MVKIEEFIFNGITYIIKIGQNQQDNWDLIDNSNPNDIWFHTSNYPSSHIVLENNSISVIQKQVLKRCACICKAHSKAKNVSKVNIVYTPIYNIQKTNVVGQVSVSNDAKTLCI